MPSLCSSASLFFQRDEAARRLVFPNGTRCVHVAVDRPERPDREHVQEGGPVQVKLFDHPANNNIIPRPKESDLVAEQFRLFA